MYKHLSNNKECPSNSHGCKVNHKHYSLITKAKEEEREEWKRAYASARDDGRREMVWLAEEHYWDSLEKDKDIILSHLRSLLPTGDNKQV